MKICHLSDIHWKSLKEHEVYTRAFNMLFAQLREQLPDAIIITGDTWHTKTSGITPEAIRKMTWMFNGLAAIAPLFVTLGNHDCLINNSSREDAISPILSAIDNPKIHLMKMSGNYFHTINGLSVNFCNFSCCDKENWDIVKPSTEEDVVNIALFHGSVTGAETDLDWILEGSEVDVSFFQDYDYVFLGDIHKHQTLDLRETEEYIVTEEELEKVIDNYGHSCVEEVEIFEE